MTPPGHAETGEAHIDTVERGLRCYVIRVAAGLGLGAESLWCELADTDNAYLALRDQLPANPTRDLALLWDDTRGWALGMETGSGEDPLILARYGTDLLPPPEDVLAFAKTIIAHYPDTALVPATRRPTEPDALETRLAGYAERP